MPPKGLKLKSDQSQFQPKAVSKEEFEKIADTTHEIREVRKNEIFELGSKFIKIIKDKTLEENRSPTATSIENEIITKLVNLSIQVNMDETEIEAMGAMGMVLLLVRSNMLFRDRCNELECKLEQVSKKVEKLEKSEPK